MSDVPQITQNFGRPSYRPDVQAGGLGADMRRMAIVAAIVGGGLALVIGGFSLSRQVHHGVPVILAEAGPVRIKPLDAGGMKVAGAEEIASGAETLSPVSEKPALHALRAKSRPMVQPLAPAAVAKVAEPPVTVARQAAVTPVTPASAEPAGTEVQLAAFESQQAAEQDWGKMAEHIPGLFNGHRPQIERAQLAGRTIYRLRTGGFVNIAAATDFCGKVRARGGDCTIAAF